MRKLLYLAAIEVAACTASAASATVFTGTYTESHLTADPGLVLQTNNLAPSPFTFNLTNVGDTAQQNLFQLYTNENSVELDDFANKPISVTLDFTTPDVFGGGVAGGTHGAFTITGLFTHDEFGTVVWNNNGNTILNFGNGGQLGVHLDDANFNLRHDGLFDGSLTPGLAGAATITADFTLISNPVPEPATWALMIGGFGMAGAALRRRRAAALAA